MDNWTILNEEERIDAWDKFYAMFKFKPSNKNFPSIETTLPQIKFNIKNCFSPDYPFNELEQLALELFKGISKLGERMFALDWQHSCYDFDPRKDMDRNEFDEWIVPIFPNGDYYIFLTRDFNDVWFGHPWEKTITLIGQNLAELGQQKINEFEKINITVHNTRYRQCAS